MPYFGHIKAKQSKELMRSAEEQSGLTACGNLLFLGFKLPVKENNSIRLEPSIESQHTG